MNNSEGSESSCTQRGEIYNPKRAGQLRDFSGLRFGKITPTDIDGFIDFRNKLHIYIEAKYEDTELWHGQRLALERICDNCKIPCTVVVVSHRQPVNEMIDFANADVIEYRWERKWHHVTRPATCREFIEAMLIHCKIVIGDE